MIGYVLPPLARTHIITPDYRATSPWLTIDSLVGAIRGVFMSRARMQVLESGGLLASLALRRPREFSDRVAGYADLGLDLLSGSSPAYETVGWKGALVVVETGVAYGVSSAFILRALEENGRGVLHSVDLPPLRREYERFWGVAVDRVHRGRWSLHRGSSARILPRLLDELETVDLFVHDSLPTYRNMRREFEAVWPHLRTGGALVADDVERNRAFGELQRKNPALWRVVRDGEER